MKQRRHTSSYLLSGVAFILLMLLQPSPVTEATSAPEPVEPTPPAIQSRGALVGLIHFSGPDELREWATTLDIWETNPQQNTLLALLSPADQARLARAGIRFTINLEKTAQLDRPLTALAEQVQGIPGYPCYRTVEETYSSLSQLASGHPELAVWKDIGASWEMVTPGGAPGYHLNALVLTNHSIPGPKPVFFLMSEIHARELVTAETATRLAEELVNNYGVDPDITWLLDYFEVHILPMANPDGRKLAETGLYWRKNTDSDDGCPFPSAWGTDLNRNSSFHWDDSWADYDACSETYRGPGAASEPETQSIQNYVTSLFADQRGPSPIDAAPSTTTGVFITLHSYGQLVLWPWGFTSNLPPNSGAMQTLGRKLAYFNHYMPQQAYQLYPTSGTTDDWAYGELGIAAYTIEMGTNFFESCDAFDHIIYPDNRLALLYAIKTARHPYQNPAGPDTLLVSVSPAAIKGGQAVELTAQADDTRYSPVSGEAVQEIAAAHFTVDAPSWLAGGPQHPMQAVDSGFNSPLESISATLDTTCLSPGRHTIFVESQDAAANWGVPSAAFLQVSASHAAGLTPAQATLAVQPGSSASLHITARNSGNVADIFQVTASSAWTTTLTTPVISLEACGQTGLEISVTAPLTATPGMSIPVNLLMTSQADPSQSAAVVLTALVPMYAIQVSPLDAAQSGNRGTDVQYGLTITNTGNFTDTFAISTASGAWQAIMPATTGPFGPGAAGQVAVSVQVPITATNEASDRLILHITSQGDSSQVVTVTLSTSVDPIFRRYLSLVTNQRAAPGGSANSAILLPNNLDLLCAGGSGSLEDSNFRMDLWRARCENLQAAVVQ